MENYLPGNNKSQPRIPAFNFIRAVCAIGIIINHYSIETNNDALKQFCYTYASGEGSIGYTLVTVFILVSGALLYYNNGNISDSRKFYLKRIKTIFPSYYVAYLLALLGLLITNRQYFVNKPIYLFPLSLIGMDGYLSGILPTWRLIGEWFIGAIIILYILYPILARCFYKYSYTFVFLCSSLFIISLNWKMLEENAFRNIFSLIFSFVLGMVFIRYKVYELPLIGFWALLTFLAFYIIPTGVCINLSAHIVGIALFVILFKCGQKVMNIPILEHCINKISKVSYEMFLIQRIVIVYTLRMYFPRNILLLLLLLVAVIVVTYIGAVLIQKLTQCLEKAFKHFIFSTRKK